MMNSNCISLFPDKLLTPVILGSKRENRSFSGSADRVSLHCEVVSFGPTHIQWLRQLRDGQKAKDQNKTIVVFDYIFEVKILTRFSIVTILPFIKSTVGTINHLEYLAPKMKSFENHALSDFPILKTCEISHHFAQCFSLRENDFSR